MSIEPIRTRNCPICRRKTDLRYRPFCSKHCADVDLGRWLSGTYAIPAEETGDEEGWIDKPSETDD